MPLYLKNILSPFLHQVVPGELYNIVCYLPSTNERVLVLHISGHWEMHYPLILDGLPR